MKTLNLKKVLATTLAVMLLVPATALAKGKPKTGDLPPQASTRKIEFRVDNKPVIANKDMGQWFLSKNGVTYMPIRMFQEAMSYKLDYKISEYDTSLYALHVTKYSKDDSLDTLFYYHEKGKIDDLFGKKYSMNGGVDRNFKENQSPILYGNRLYMPAREILEAFGETVTWERLPDKDVVNVTINAK